MPLSLYVCVCVCVCSFRHQPIHCRCAAWTLWYLTGQAGAVAVPGRGLPDVLGFVRRVLCLFRRGFLNYARVDLGVPAARGRRMYRAVRDLTANAYRRAWEEEEEEKS